MESAGGGRPGVLSSPVWVVVVVVLLLLLGSPALGINVETAESHSEFSCEPIRLRMCQDLPYNTTFMPNLLNHYDQQTAALAMEVSGVRLDYTHRGKNTLHFCLHSAHLLFFFHA